MSISRRSWSLVGALALFAAAPASAESPAPSQRESGFEVRFMTGMIDHHMMAIRTAELCTGMAVHAELQALCASIIETQTAEMMEMQAWLADWYGISYEPQMQPGMEQLLERYAAMTPEDFEIAFLQMMIRHHWKAVREGEHCLDAAYHPELLQTCSDIVAAQTTEIATMKQWLCDWYGRCRQGPQVE